MGKNVSTDGKFMSKISSLTFFLGHGIHSQYFKEGCSDKKCHWYFLLSDLPFCFKICHIAFGGRALPDPAGELSTLPIHH